MQVFGITHEPTSIEPLPGETLAAFIARLPLPRGYVLAAIELNWWDKLVLPLSKEKGATLCEAYYCLTLFNARTRSALTPRYHGERTTL